jgi:hypothetical protein
MKKEELVYQLMCQDVSVKKSKKNMPDMRCKANKKLYNELMSDDKNILAYRKNQVKLTPLERVKHFKNICNNPEIYDSEMNEIKRLYTE